MKRTVTARRYRLVVAVFALVAGLLVAPPPAAAKSGGDDDKLVVFSKDLVRGEIVPDKALVYVVRTAGVGLAVKSWFFADDEVLGVNRGKSYFFAHVDPGTHVFWSRSENVDALELEVEAGKTYFIQQHVQMGIGRARTKLEVLDPELGEKRLAKCKKHGTMTEAGRELGMQHVVEYMDNTQKDLDRRARQAEKAGGNTD